MTKSQPQIKIVNCTTGEEIVRDANAEEIAQMEVYAEQEAARQIEIEARAAQRQAILDRIGLTADEAKLILG